MPRVARGKEGGVFRCRSGEGSTPKAAFAFPSQHTVFAVGGADDKLLVVVRHGAPPTHGAPAAVAHARSQLQPWMRGGRGRGVRADAMRCHSAEHRHGSHTNAGHFQGASCKHIGAGTPPGRIPCRQQRSALRGQARRVLATTPPTPVPLNPPGTCPGRRQPCTLPASSAGNSRPVRRQAVSGDRVLPSPAAPHAPAAGSRDPCPGPDPDRRAAPVQAHPADVEGTQLLGVPDAHELRLEQLPKPLQSLRACMGQITKRWDGGSRVVHRTRSAGRALSTPASYPGGFI